MKENCNWNNDLYHNILMLQLGYIYGNFIPLQTFDAESR